MACHKEQRDFEVKNNLSLVETTHKQEFFKENLEWFAIIAISLVIIIVGFLSN